MAQRIYKTASIYEARVVGMRNLWDPSTEYMGKKQDKPSYIVSVIIKKTRANWYEEPTLAAFTQAASALYSEALSHIPFQQVEWPFKDGDIPDPVRGQAEWRKGHWFLTGSSTSPIEVSIIENGVPVPLKNRMNVKNGDYVGLAVSIAVKMNDPRGVKVYVNKVMFMAPGEEIVLGSSVSNMDLMEEAKAKGLNVTGFSGGAPQQGFGQGFAPPPASPASPPAPAGFGMAGAGNASFPSSGLAPPPVSPPAQQGFTTPSGFIPPRGFPPRQ